MSTRLIGTCQRGLRFQRQFQHLSIWGALPANESHHVALLAHRSPMQFMTKPLPYRSIRALGTAIPRRRARRGRRKLGPTEQGFAVPRRGDGESAHREATAAGNSARRPVSSSPADSGAFRIVIVGRPNVGKSTLYNRLATRNRAIVTPIAGTTRDRKGSTVSLGGMTFDLTDTGGLEDGADQPWKGPPGTPHPGMAQVVLKKTEEAIKDSDVVLFMVDARSGVTEADKHYARWARKRQGKHRGVYVIVNKTEGQFTDQMSESLDECGRLGLGEPLPISASHGDGMGELAALLVPHYNAWEAERLEEARSTTEDEEAVDAGEERESRMPAAPGRDDPVELAFVGRPNVGKSSLLNAVLRENRALTGPTPGLTRDAVPVEWTWAGRSVRLVDTAGIRKWGSRDKTTPLEELAVKDSMNAINKAQVVVLVLDGTDGVLRKTELTIAGIAAKEGRALVVAANKSDLVRVRPLEYARGVTDQVEALMPDVRGPPVLSVCALTGQGVGPLMRAVVDARDRWRARVPTAVLNRWLRKMVFLHPPPRDPTTGGACTLKFLTQVKRGPPEFRAFVNRLSLPEDYRRYIVKNLQKEFGFQGMQVRLTLKKSVNIYDPEGSGGAGGRGRRKRKVGRKGRPLPIPPSPTRYR